MDGCFSRTVESMGNDEGAGVKCRSSAPECHQQGNTIVFVTIIMILVIRVMIMMIMMMW